MKRHFFPEIPKEFRLKICNIRQIDEFEPMLKYLKIEYLKTDTEIIINGWENNLSSKPKIANKLIESIFNHVSEIQLKLN